MHLPSKFNFVSANIFNFFFIKSIKKSDIFTRIDHLKAEEGRDCHPMFG